jgi:hypothetical protein
MNIEYSIHRIRPQIWIHTSLRNPAYGMTGEGESKESIDIVTVRRIFDMWPKYGTISDFPMETNGRIYLHQPLFLHPASSLRIQSSIHDCTVSSVRMGH